MRQFAYSAVAGLAATLPMTAAREWMHGKLPPHQRQELPPRKITSEVMDAVGIEPKSEQAQQDLTLASHFGYGAAAGVLYAALAPRLKSRPVVSGIGFGVAIWAVSYLGLMPTFSLYPSAAKEPARRNLLMIVAHVIWGASLGIIDQKLQRRTLESM